eukprot:1180409-Prorocentrum_minimum.AAC.3
MKTTLKPTPDLCTPLTRLAICPLVRNGLVAANKLVRWPACGQHVHAPHMARWVWRRYLGEGGAKSAR